MTLSDGTGAGAGAVVDLGADSGTDRARRPVPALRRGLAALTLLASRPGPISAASIARELGLARSSAYELLSELAAAGFATHVPEQRRWGLGPAAFEIGSAYLRSQPLEQLATPMLTRLAHTTGGTTHLGVLHGAETLYLARQRPARGPTLITHVGVRLPAALTATGLAILAALPAAQVRALFPGSSTFITRTARGVRTVPELRARLTSVRRRGWAVEDGEVSPDTASLAAAVFDHNGLPTAAIGVTVDHRCPPQSGKPPHLSRSTQSAGAPAGCGIELTEFATVVRSAADALTRAIGGHEPQ
ncbi:MAG: IclR family transcriptional regulator [Nakamurella sp.]